MSINSIYKYPYSPDQDLSKYHLQQLTNESGLSQEILISAKPFSLSGRFVQELGIKDAISERLNLRNYSDDILIFPYPGYPDIFRARLDAPIKDKDDNFIRYMQPRKQRNVPYIVPLCGPTRHSDTIFITEGEKKTLALAQAGCNTIGFGGVWNWKDKSSPTGVIPDIESFNYLGKTIAIVFDSDTTTNKDVLNAEKQFTKFCLDHGASKVLRLRIPYSDSQKLGIDDYLKDHAPSVIDELIANAIVENGFINGAELIENHYEPNLMLTSFLPERSLVLIAGLPGAGKTEFFINQAIEAAQKGPILCYLSEGGPLDIQNRLQAHCQDKDILKNILCELNRLPNFSDPKKIEEFARTLETYKPKAIFIDPGPDAFEEENDASVLKEPLAQLYHLTEKYTLSIVLSWHISKTAFVTGVYAFRGSSAIAGKMDLVYHLKTQNNKRTLSLDKLRLTCPGLSQYQKWYVDMIETGTGKNLRFTDHQVASEIRINTKNLRLSEALSRFTAENEYTSTEIVDTIMDTFDDDLGETTAKKQLKKWVKDGYFRMSQRNRGSQPARYQRTNSEVPLEP